ncbi:endonuclease MutS2 [Bacillus sp. SM2101]|uniref:endonuclease MutS2 n=1 Tax=Bacillus sp. SM2101 TaxID=2805366 RepID=UPI001BDEA395|nr:endonuclease MutS2 [Bacillus sp. SM2101]
MLERVLKTLEFNKIKDLLVTHVASSLGKAKVDTLMPATKFEEVVKLQEQTDEAVKILRLKGNVPLGGIFDIRSNVKRAKINSTLHPEELLDIANTIYAGRQIQKFTSDMIEDDHDIPYFHELSYELIPFRELEDSIKQCINDYGEIYDHASSKLRTIRQQLRTSEARIREKLESIIRSSSAQKKLSDVIITIRNDRFVIPVKQEYRSSYGGIVHDQSSSGATLFIEPQVVVELNNLLHEAKIKEKQEIEKILHELTVNVAEEADGLLHNIDILAEIDFMFTKAKYARSIKASKPVMNNDRYIRLVKAKHPLIDPDEVVPNDIELGKDYSTILITGPNTGGKTVALKTIGLCTLMAQSGLQIPAEDGSEMSVFSSIYADIGDEQSIEQSLSTFSSHMVNIVDILQQFNSESLVLFDELGAGTDPQEGAALAISILDEVYQKGARVVATTHYPELKAYGYNRDGVINASVEFDVETLSPTYRLLIGVPGRSNAFDISRRLGLDEQVIYRAKKQISTESNTVENMIASLEDSKKHAEEKLEEAERLRKEAKDLHKKLEDQMTELASQKDVIFEQAEQKARETVNIAKQEAESIIGDLRKIQKEQYAQVKEHELIDAKKRLEAAAPKLNKSKNNIIRKKNEQSLQPGDEVKVISLDQKGHLLEKASSKEWLVQLGIMKMKVKESDLQYASRPKPIETKPLVAIKGKEYHVSLELDLRGERFENAILRVEKYLDDAILAGYPRVSIIHGKGTGALRKGVQDLLKNHRAVKKVRYGEASEGGSGISIVELK